MKGVFGLGIILSLIGLLVYGAYRGAVNAWEWATDTRPDQKAARTVEQTLDKGIEATSDTDWFNRAMTGRPEKKR
ncbi:hypothetical protein L0Y59_01270 [Candidatus Uhrbacteria bacterium]|nr:hypothetical protein [Candidatus Uhrbacteria bacterium]